MSGKVKPSSSLEIKRPSTLCTGKLKTNRPRPSNHHRSHGGKTKPPKPLQSCKTKTWDSFQYPLSYPEHELINSPDGSSTASSEGIPYVRVPGFDHHSHSFVDDSKWSKLLDDYEQELEGDDADENVDDSAVEKKLSADTSTLDQNGNITSTKRKKNIKNGDNKDVQKNASDAKSQNSASTVRQRLKKEPLPMKLRALPQSFWQQPNNTNVLSPGAVYPVLPPLASDSRELTPPEGRPHEEVVSDANTDLLFSLFRNVENEQRINQGHQPKVAVVKRGRPKKPPSNVSKGALKDDDPCLVSTVTEAILPLIPDRTNTSQSIQARIQEEQQVLAMVTLNGNKTTLSFPTIRNIDHNYSQILSELVVQL